MGKAGQKEKEEESIVTDKGGNMRKSKRHGLYRREGDIYAFRYKDNDGKWREKFTGKTDYQLAKHFKDEFEDNLKNGTPPTEKSAWTVEQAARLWTEQHAAHLG